MAALPLAVLLGGLPWAVDAPEGWERLVVTDVADDSRACRPGSLFLAMPGTRADGAGFLGDARERGAVAAVVRKSGRAGQRVLPAVLVPAHDLRRAAAILTARFYGEPAKRLDLIGVTGTNGKTTVVTLIRQLAGPDLALAYWSTAGVDSGRRRFRPVLTTPAPPVLHRFLADAVAAEKRGAVLEVSSHGISLERLYGLAFRVGVVTNISPDHLDFHGSFEAYAAAKRSFAQSIQPPGRLWLNGDDPVVREFGHGAGVPVYLYGVGPTNDLRARVRGVRREGSRVAIWLGPRLRPRSQRGAAFAWSLPLPGLHNVMNALAAFGTSLSLGIRPEVLSYRLERATPPPRRMETVRIGGYTVINDVAMNPASFDAVLEVVAEAGYPRLVVVAALRGNRGEEVNAEIAERLAAWNHRLGFAPLILSLSERAVAADLADHAPRPVEVHAFCDRAEAGGLAVDVHPELEEAIYAGIHRLGEEGALLLLGTFGMDDGPALALSELGRRLRVDLTLPRYATPETGA